MNIQDFIKAKEEEFDEKFKHPMHCDTSPFTKASLRLFFSQSLLEYNEKIKEMCEQRISNYKECIKDKLGDRTELEDRIDELEDFIITNLTIKDNENTKI